MNTMTTMVMVAGLITFAAPAQAQHAGDILLEQNYQGRICTGLVDEETGAVSHNARVFRATFGETANFTNEPGMDSDAGAFAYPAAIGFNIRKALRKWNGVDFGEIPAERIRIKLATLGPVETPGSDQVVPGFAMAVGSDGEFHHHPGFTLTGEASDGVYLLELELWSDRAEILPSRPYWIVFNQNDTMENHEAALAWAGMNLPGCVSDLDGSGFIDTDDYDAFVRAYEAGDFTADVDHSGFVDTDDFDFFVRAFEGGC